MTTTASRSPTPQRPPARRFAVIGAGMAGVACARTLMQAGHSVSVFERQERPGGRMATQETPFGSFDAGAQFFTVRDARFERALQTVNGLCRPWSATSLRVLDATGQMVAAPPAPEPHWVAQPGMQSLLTTWAEPIAQAGCLHTDTQAVRLERDRLHPQGWQLACEASDGSAALYAGFDASATGPARPQGPCPAAIQRYRQHPAGTAAQRDY